MRKIKEASFEELEPLIGKKKAAIVKGLGDPSAPVDVNPEDVQGISTN